jgi:hypothetical protein
VKVSEKQCRLALQACLRNGWLRVVDQDALDEVTALLQGDPVLLPISLTAHCQLDEIDFTSSGSVLYRMIMEEWRGPDWENELHVEKETYAEVHYYSEALDGFGSLLLQLSRERTFRVLRIACLGPWCVSWWRRFPHGFRLELEVGVPSPESRYQSGGHLARDVARFGHLDEWH